MHFLRKCSEKKASSRFCRRIISRFVPSFEKEPVFFQRHLCSSFLNPSQLVYRNIYSNSSFSSPSNCIPNSGLSSFLKNETFQHPSSFQHSSKTKCNIFKENISVRQFSNSTFPIDVGQPSPETHPELFSAGEIVPGISAQEFKDRRSRVSDLLPDGSILLVCASSEKYASGKIPYPYRHDSNFFYLTGCCQKGGFGLIEKDKIGKNGSSPKFTLFMPETSSHTELWDGKVANADVALSFFEADEAYTLAQMNLLLSNIINKAGHVYYDKHSSDLHLHVSALQNCLNDCHVRFPNPIIDQIRFVKSNSEIKLLKQSATIISNSFKTTMLNSKNNPYENYISSLIEFECRKQGAKRMAFPSVAASGINACTIHYSRNDKKINDGDLVLLDSGCEYFGYCSDVTRTWPKNGKFSNAQKEVYISVLNAFKECIKLCKPGVSLAQIHKKSVEVLSEGIARLGIIPSSSPSSISLGAYRKLYPTSIGHWLGLDLHDVSTIPHHKKLEPGVVLTIEPGLYIPKSSDYPEKYHGIGIRIEDDILITNNGFENLTNSIPKEMEEIEEMLK